MPLPAIPAIAAILARGAAVVGRVVGPLLARGAAQAAPALAAATPAAPSAAGSVAAAGARAGVAPAVSQAMASTPTGAAASTPAVASRLAGSSATQATVNVNVQQAGQQAARAPRWRGAPVTQTPTLSAPQTPSTLSRAFGPLMNLVRPPAAQQAAQAGAQQAAQQAGESAQQSSFQNAARRAQNAAQRFAQRGAQLYQGVRNDTQEQRREDYKEFRTNLNAGLEAMKNYDPKALAFWGKAAGIGLKYLTAIVAGPIGITAFFALLPKKLRDFGDALLEARRPLAEINGGMAATFARFDAERLGRNMRFASMTSGSTEGLARAVSRLEERILPYAAAGVNALNNLLILGERFTSFLQGAMETLHPELKVIIGLLAKDDGGKSSGDLAQFALSMKNGEYFQRRKPPEPPKDKKDKPGYDGRFMG